MSYRTEQQSDPRLTFSDTELRDLAVAWTTLSVAFALILTPVREGQAGFGEFVLNVGLSFVTVGVGFLLHEIAHKVVAVEHGQIAEFRADYQMLFLALMGAFVDFLFAAPGAVYHQGRVTQRENGLIALAGPVTNLLLVLLFLPLVILPGVFGVIGKMGIWINLFLATFNMIPFGPLDGKSVFQWSKPVFAAVFGLSVLLLAGFVSIFGLSPL